MRPRKSNNKNKGLIFNIQRFSIHDGPGIRTTVFMKSCPLRCLWCANPESQDPLPNLMVRDINCRGCGACVEVCPEGAITLTKEEGRRIDWGSCTQCLRCADACLYNSLNTCGEFIEVEEVLGEVMKDEAFYNNSGGGITISGGEALSQNGFVTDLLRNCKNEGLHTALDTSGYAPWETLEKVLPFVDLALWDIKHLDPREHKRATGVDNELILENLKKASPMVKRIWLRMPLIPDFNDAEDHVREIAILGEKIGAEKISLLPYHEGGKSKSEQMGRLYRFQAEEPTEEQIYHLKEIIEKAGINVSIGH